MSRLTSYRLTLLFVFALLLVAGAFTQSAPVEAQGAHGDLVRDQWIVTLKDGANPHMMAQASGGRVLHVYEHALNGFAVQLPEAAARALLNNPNVLSVEQDRVVKLEAFEQHETPNLMHFQGSQTTPTGVQRIYGTRTATVNLGVAVIDTGIQTNHPDLNVKGGKNCVKGPNSFNDGHGHGTHVAGTIGALNNGIGVIGVAPGVDLYAVRVLDNRGSGTTSTIICGVDWVTSMASTIKVANMSLGGSGSDSNCGGSDSYHNAICRSVAAGVTYVVAAGNSSADANNYRPATYAEVITVSALADFNGLPGGGAAATCRADEDDTFANFSNYGADVDLIAPGVCILSTWLNGGYNTISGTSMAAPHVAGAAALYKALNPSATPAQIQAALQQGGNYNWDNRDDRDNIKEPLLDMRSVRVE